METRFTHTILEDRIERRSTLAEQFLGLIKAAALRQRSENFFGQLTQAPAREPKHIATDAGGVVVHLSKEHWDSHILAGHPEIAHYREYIIQAIERPDNRYHEGYDTNNRYFIRYYANIPDHVHEYVNRKHIVVIVKYVPSEKFPGGYAGNISTSYLETP